MYSLQCVESIHAPDLRIRFFGMELINVTDLFENTNDHNNYLEKSETLVRRVNTFLILLKKS
jgi:hypothetical protein